MPPQNEKVILDKNNFFLTLYFYIFRRKPAVVKFDKPFIPNYNSPKTFTTVIS